MRPGNRTRGTDRRGGIPRGHRYEPEHAGVCLLCGQPFKAARVTGSRRRKWCSPMCRDDAKRIVAILTGDVKATYPSLAAMLAVVGTRPERATAGGPALARLFENAGLERREENDF